MSVRAMSAVWDLDLPDSDKIVLLALADCANDEGHCWPSIASLVRKCSKSERTIQGCIKRLVDEGHVTRREVIGKGCNYTVHPNRSRIPNPGEGCAPAKTAPPQGTTQTPAAAADKPSRTINTEAKASLNRVVDAWNEMADKAGVHKVRVLDSSRKQMLRLRIGAHGVEAILEAVRMVGRSKFLRGLEGDGRKADINIILQPKTLARVLEGFYGIEGRPEPTVAEQIAMLERLIPIYQRDRPEFVEATKQKIEALRGPPDPAVIASVAQMTRGFVADKSVGRAAAR